MFCPKCGSILVPRKKGKKTEFCCTSCKYSTEDISPTISEKVKREDRNFEVVDKDIEPMSMTEATCPKCGHHKAYYWFLQTRASDEAATQFLKCEKCKHQWRVYD